jgi:radical SAM protein with 4Fe4S-binding SPASM domain
LHRLKKQLKYIPVNHLHIEAEIQEHEKISFVLNDFQYEEVLLHIEDEVNQDQLENYKKICVNRDKNFTFSRDGRKKINDLNVEIFDFFYNQHFNPCLGQQVSVDCDGEIKTCLWARDVLGNIFKDNLMDMIMSESFDYYWELTKDKIEICKDCEFRYACLDCRVSGTTADGNYSITGKPSYCNYNPYTGEYEL